MNLIEQLGGYEKAKAFLNATSFTIDELIMMQRSGLRTQHVEKALLEYRRQHNIYEVGDKVVVKAHPFWPEDYVIHTVEQEHIGKWYMSAWRHATDAEIQAGKRLEVS
ncbi:hypothetical protein 7F8_31 [uncultured Caudovirales phage]|uniref:Uncharacterized protein n=1 Tax=uncultured Caudovirales phage TaxID=2100421 RepID=A0A2H4J8T6_9CAUD|nr:hypothetical protein 7AX4_33 [uncultured Caudovirales phage]ASN70354.1 hypothetical protein 8AX11_31 [uncultured Caudovirales phage]ASN70413.1 hypothetical protein 7F8_31 [uncultured Caudovirales phage]